jgi:transposase
MGGHQADVAEQGARPASWDDRRVLNGICWVLRSGAPWRVAGLLWPMHHLLQPFRPVAKGRSVGRIMDGLMMRSSK